MTDSKPEQLIQDIHGSRIVRTLTPEGWDTVLFCPWPDAAGGVDCKDLSEAIQIAKEAKASRERLDAEKLAAKSKESPEKSPEPEVIAAGTIAEGLGEVIQRALDGDQS